MTKESALATISRYDNYNVKAEPVASGYRQLYQNVVPLEVMLNRFDFGNNTRFEHRNFFSEQNAVHQRYHKPPKSTKAKISAIFRQRILDKMTVKKHELVRRDAKEREKLETIE